MKRVICAILLICVCLSVGAQKKFYTPSGLLEYLQQSDNLFSDFDERKIETCANFDFKTAYYNDSLKNILLELLSDTVGWANYYFSSYRDGIKKDSDKKYQECLIKSHLESNGKQFVDSALSDETLRLAYLDSSITDVVKRNMQRWFDNPGSYIPSSLIRLIGDIKYSEAYPVLMSYYKEAKDEYTKDRYYSVLLEGYDCPEFVNNLKERIDKRDFSIMGWGGVRYIFRPNSVSTSLLSYSLDIADEVDDGMDNKIPFNVFLIEEYHHSLYRSIFYEPEIQEFKGWDVMSDVIQLMYFRRAEACKTILKKLSKLREFLSLLQEHYLQQELYWKRNMPYYKGEE